MAEESQAFATILESVLFGVVTLLLLYLAARVIRGLELEQKNGNYHCSKCGTPISKREAVLSYRFIMREAEQGRYFCTPCQIVLLDRWGKLKGTPYDPMKKLE